MGRGKGMLGGGVGRGREEWEEVRGCCGGVGRGREEWEEVRGCWGGGREG